MLLCCSIIFSNSITTPTTSGAFFPSGDGSDARPTCTPVPICLLYPSSDYSDTEQPGLYAVSSTLCEYFICLVSTRKPQVSLSLLVLAQALQEKKSSLKIQDLNLANLGFPLGLLRHLD